MAWTVRSTQDVTYRVQQSESVFDPANDALASVAGLGRGSRRLVIVDRNVDRLYGEAIRAYFAAWTDTRPTFLVLEPDEAAKTSDALLLITRAAVRAGINRRSDPIVAIGGGVVTDLAGLAASLYRRGTPFVRIPTTLIGLVDASVGAKTAINFDGHKNRLGTYFPAAHTLLDRTLLTTLPARHIRNGLAEIIKMAVMKDAALFSLVEDEADALVTRRFDTPHAPEIIERSVTGMLEELEPNLWEHELKRLVDFGHTFSPVIEMHAAPELLHGEAVSIDMAFSCALAHENGLLGHEETLRVLRLLHRTGLPIRHAVCDLDLLRRGLDDATGHRDGHQHVPLPTGIGEATFVEDITTEDLKRAMAFLDAYAPATGGRTPALERDASAALETVAP
ncbi:sedoheptulose 7-phosphate cyclase [Streptomyces varsoviensis]|uniref:2-epi-5-epi-valiolone synthase n=1 Tax=Streptomyces varsoviensis TaxID=67373 RepID=A0ABR5JE77_9ACTN|nr:sedoheptulose 7-phosphate cyclase [Streptomyces varsoviensis]KOG91674.1 2-epi-5-epi-valiolone synthase [Streptomyces varsoviensis]